MGEEMGERSEQRGAGPSATPTAALIVHRSPYSQPHHSSHFCTNTSPDAATTPITNFTAALPSSHYARLYKDAGLGGGHVIMLGADGASAAAAREALAAFPGGLQVGGGITPSTAPAWIDAGAAAVIVTSYVFVDGRLDEGRLEAMVGAVGRERLVLDLSCRKRQRQGAGAGAAGDGTASPPSPSSPSPPSPAWEYVVVADRWQTFTDTPVNAGTLGALGSACCELLVHGVDVEGMRLGVDADLVALLGAACPVPVTYAGGVAAMGDLETVASASGGRVDVTVGSALDIFGGDMAFEEVVAWSRRQQAGAGGRV
jgi:phosphoribosylformimino-5-aminoimidazole carboxamide ribotide isomerase